MNNLDLNHNHLSPTSFKLAIDALKYANTEYTIVSFNLPELTLGEVAVPYREFTGYIPGDRLQFGQLSLNIIVDEQLKNYSELYNWIRDNAQDNDIVKSDMILTIMDSKNNLTKQIQFTNAFPTSLGTIEFNTQRTDVEYIQVNVTFRYDAFVLI